MESSVVAFSSAIQCHPSSVLTWKRSNFLSKSAESGVCKSIVCGLGQTQSRKSKALQHSGLKVPVAKTVQTRQVNGGASLQSSLRRSTETCRTLWLNGRDGVLAPRASQATVQELAGAEGVKERLLEAVRGLDRGAKASREERAIMQELMVELEGMAPPGQVDLGLLSGDWKLIYTTASDVISILKGNELPLFKIGYIGQCFTWDGDRAEGVVENVVRWSVAGLLESEGATLRVKAKYNVVAPRTIALSFEQAEVGDVKISEALQALIAPAVIDRGMFPLQVLQQLKSLSLHVPLGSKESATVPPERAGAGLRYFLSYLDDSFLLGRSVGSGGVFIFSRQS
eukprot:TRINITY_DN4541_c1_g4_i1.p1 TRINITY_DN4541_c1_g4~~TRINITY_DN4541_c1_g4_i1.p1  ORF type:complete len:341 (+),score=56.16 TRINITY_DN4541_c1_g4_i1:180-1202(+)